MLDGISVNNVFENKWVWLGGAAVGLMLVLMHSSSSAAPNAQNGNMLYNPGIQPSGAAYQFFTAQAGYARDLGIAQINSDAKKQADYFATLTALDTHATAIEIQRLTSNEGIAKSQITSNTALILDRQQNASRLDQAWISANVATHGQDTALAAILAQQAGQIAVSSISTQAALNEAKAQYERDIQVANINSYTQIQLKTIDKKIAAKKSDNDLFGGIVKGIASVIPFLF